MGPCISRVSTAGHAKNMKGTTQHHLRAAKSLRGTVLNNKSQNKAETTRICPCLVLQAGKYFHPYASSSAPVAHIEIMPGTWTGTSCIAGILKLKLPSFMSSRAPSSIPWSVRHAELAERSVTEDHNFRCNASGTGGAYHWRGKLLHFPGQLLDKAAEAVVDAAQRVKLLLHAIQRCGLCQGCCLLCKQALTRVPMEMIAIMTADQTVQRRSSPSDGT